MDSVSHDKSTKHHSSESKPTKKHQPSPSELLSSAKLVAEAAKSTLNHDSNRKVDKEKVAHAAGDLLGAASNYGKLEDKGYGKYLGQAENYLHKYGQKDSHSTTANSGHSAGTTAHSSSHHSDGHGKSGSEYGDYLKMAEGIFKKH
ncbi:nodulin-related protein 1-like [Pistacia vera]|uniref:nodulin-related protein 1-like n=1 Tax=Pistacia vera TaxID=55513 RepID=UPI00126376DD|nr:nodulin-related protein 1-like [Pistacia vera]